METEKPKSEPEKVVKPEPVFEIDTPTSEELEEGVSVKIEAGLICQICPQNTNEFARLAAAGSRKFGGRGADDLPRGEKLVKAANWTAARANWKGFVTPAGSREVKMGGKVYRDSVESREEILNRFPVIRSQVSDAIRDVTKAEGASLESLEGN